MNDTLQIPDHIQTLIDQKRLALEAEQKQNEEKQQREKEEDIEKGKLMVSVYVGQSLELVPEWIRPYFLNIGNPEPDYERFVKGWDRVENCSLYFSIPGLSEIEFSPKNNHWRSAYARWNEDDDESQPGFSFRDRYWKRDLEEVLCQAAEAQKIHEENSLRAEQMQLRASERSAERVRLHSEREAQEAERESLAEARREKKKSEEQALFDAIKNDDIAIHLLKAFVLLRDERSLFEERLYEADEQMSSIEHRWSRRAEELQRQADSAKRRAEQESDRAGDLANDLDDAQAELKKAKRGW